MNRHYPLTSFSSPTYLTVIMSVHLIPPNIPASWVGPYLVTLVGLRPPSLLVPLPTRVAGPTGRLFTYGSSRPSGGYGVSVSERRTESRRVGSSLSPLFRRVPAPVVASPLESHASYSPLGSSVSRFVSQSPRLVSVTPVRHSVLRSYTRHEVRYNRI